MKISKGPYTPMQNDKALSYVIRAGLCQQVTWCEMPKYYLMMLNFESYLDRLNEKRENVVVNNEGLKRLFLYAFVW